jgi:hypothetical protein
LFPHLRASLPATADLQAGARFLAGLPAFLRRPISLEQARAIVAERLRSREAGLLAMLRHAVYGRASSPYLALLRMAGCEYGDVERMVRCEGVEAALLTLARAGVYLTVQEWKGRAPARRGSTELWIDPRMLCNPTATIHLLGETSGSRGPRTPVPMDLRFNWDHAVNRRLSLEARGAIGWRLALWSVPGGGEQMIALRFAASGNPPERWFSPIDPVEAGLHPRYRWSVRLMRLGSRAVGVHLPGPSYVSLDNPLPIARWLRHVLDAGDIPHIKTMPGSAVRLCQEAEAAGVDIDGARFTLTGEPLTAGKLAAIWRVGADAVSDYGSTESGAVAEWCAAPIEPDDTHLFEDQHAVIQPGLDSESVPLPSRALLLTSLRPTTPLHFFNTSLGDQAELSERSCGCPMETFGWRRHLHGIRSFEKLTLADVNLLDVDVVRVLEQTLPSRFGGGPADYQLVERTATEGPSTLSLVIDPSIGPLDEAAVVETFLEALGAVGGTERLVEAVWREGRVLKVERRTPHQQATGKVLHVHVERPVRS